MVNIINNIIVTKSGEDIGQNYQHKQAKGRTAVQLPAQQWSISFSYIDEAKKVVFAFTDCKSCRKNVQFLNWFICL